MSLSTTLVQSPSAPRTSLQAMALDTLVGAFVTLKLTVAAAGCAALLTLAYVWASESTRERIRVVTPLALAAWVGEASDDAADAAEQAAALPAADPQQSNVAAYLARRYRVADDAVRRIVAHAFAVGQEKQLDPLLILAVTAIESGLNPLAQSPVGAQGLMQVMTRVHTDKFEAHGGEAAALDPVANIEVGASILGDLISRGGSVERGLQLYVGAGNLPDDGGYGAKVLAERSRLQMAAQGKVAAAVQRARASQPAPEARAMPATVSGAAPVAATPRPV